jgi:hypothetical protein
MKQRENMKKVVDEFNHAIKLFAANTGGNNSTSSTSPTTLDLTSDGLFNSDSQLQNVNKEWGRNFYFIVLFVFVFFLFFIFCYFNFNLFFLFLKIGSTATEVELMSTKKILEEKKHKVTIVSNEKEALEKIKQLIPEGASIYTAGSTTLSQIGFTDYLKGDTPYHNLKSLALAEKDPHKQAEFYRQGMFADYFISSVTAVSQEGKKNKIKKKCQKINQYNKIR